MKKVVSPLIFIVLLASITPTVLYPMMAKSQTEVLNCAGCFGEADDQIHLRLKGIAQPCVEMLTYFECFR